MRFLFGLIIGIVGGIAAMHLLAQDRPSIDVLELPSPIKVKLIEATDRAERVRFDFKDGRSYVFRLSSVAASAWFPEEWARLEGLDHPYIDFVLPGRTVRLDIPDEEIGREIYSLVFSGELGAAWQD